MKITPVKIVLYLACLLLFFVNVKDWLDWGDDYAQYIHQAENILNGKSPDDAGYIFNKDFTLYAPAYYPQGFPVLLLPVLILKGSSAYHLQLYLTLFLAIYGILIFQFLKRYYSELISALLTIIFLFNPWTLSFKSDILSDIPFSLLLLLTTMLFTNQRKRNTVSVVLLSFLIGYSVFIRSAGFTLPVALVSYSIFLLYKNRREKNIIVKKEAGNGIVIAILSLAIYFLLNKFVFPPLSGSVSGYQSVFNFSQLISTALNNLTYYTGVFRAFFEPWNDNWHFISVISSSMIFTFIILGIIKKMKTNFEFIDMLFVVYIFVIIIYLYANGGFRFIFPLAPFLLMYLMKGILSVNINFKTNKIILAIGLTLFVLFSYKKGIVEIVKNEKNISEGPQLPENKEMISYIINNTPTDARFSFKRPRTLALYTNRSGITHRREASMEEIENNFREYKINYILINQEGYDQSMIDFINAKKENTELIWENSRNKIYRVHF